MAGNRGGHAQPRVRVDVGATDVTLHQLVGDVIILGQELPGYIERDRVRAMLRDDPGKSFTDRLQRLVPGYWLAVDPGMEEAAFQAQSLPQCVAFRAECPEVG